MSEVTKFEKLIGVLGELSEALELRCAHNPESVDMEWAEAVDKAVDILHMIHSWSKAYPEDIFLPVDWEQVHRALRQVDVSGSAIAADCMRYVVTTMGDQMEKMS